MSTAPIHVIWNNNAGSAEANADVLKELQARSDVEVHLPESAEETPTSAQRAAESGAQIVAAAGGDGAVNAVVQGLIAAGGNSKLAVLPLGTGNDFSRTLAVPLDLRQAVELIDTGASRRVDVVRAEISESTTYYINMATGGNTGRFMDELTDEKKKFWGPLIYLRGVVDVLSELVRFDLSVQFDDEPLSQVAALNMFVANGRTSGTGLKVAPDASIEDGFLDAIVVLDCEAIQIAGLAADFALGDYRENQHIVYRRARKVTIDSSPPMKFSADGEVLTEGPVTFEICPAALEVIVGPEYAP